MNLVHQYQKISTAIELKKDFSFAVVTFPRLNGKYCIQFRMDSSYSTYANDTTFLHKNMVNTIMRKALQYKTSHQDRIVFKEPHSWHTYNMDDVIIFNSKESAERAMMNFLMYTSKRHRSFAKKVLREAISIFEPF